MAQLGRLGACLVLLGLHSRLASNGTRELEHVARLRAGATEFSGTSRQAQEGFVRTDDGVELFYRIIGTGRDTLIVLHGGPGLDFGYLAPDLEALARAHIVIFYDQRGAGRSSVVSDSGHLNLAAHIADLEAVRRHFRIERLVLLGHSWGAGLAARYTLAYGQHVAKLILVDAMPPRYTPYTQQFAQNLRAWMDSATRTHLDALAIARDTASDLRTHCKAFWRVFIRGYFANPNDTVRIGRMRGDVCTAPPQALRNSEIVSELTWRSIGDYDWRRDFGGVRVPVLILHGANDPIPVASAREWESAFPAGHLVVLENAGHLSYVEQPMLFFRALSAFLR